MMNDTKSLVVVLKLINTCKIVHANVQLFEEAEVRGQESGWDRACEEIVTKPKRDKFDDKFEVGKVTGELIVAHIQDSELLGEDGGEFGRRGPVRWLWLRFTYWRVLRRGKVSLGCHGKKPESWLSLRSTETREGKARKTGSIDPERRFEWRSKAWRLRIWESSKGMG